MRNRKSGIFVKWQLKRKRKTVANDTKYRQLKFSPRAENLKTSNLFCVWVEPPQPQPQPSLRIGICGFVYQNYWEGEILDRTQLVLLGACWLSKQEWWPDGSKTITKPEWSPMSQLSKDFDVMMYFRVFSVLMRTKSIFTDHDSIDSVWLSPFVFSTIWLSLLKIISRFRTLPLFFCCLLEVDSCKSLSIFPFPAARVQEVPGVQWWSLSGYGFTQSRIWVVMQRRLQVVLRPCYFWQVQNQLNWRSCRSSHQGRRVLGW